MVVDKGNVDREEGEGVKVVDPPPCAPPLSPVAPQALGPQSASAPKAGAIPWLAQVLEQGCAGDQPVFSYPAHSHMIAMCILRRSIRCLIRWKKEEHRGTWHNHASGGGGGMESPPSWPPSPPCVNHQL